MPEPTVAGFGLFSGRFGKVCSWRRLPEVHQEQKEVQQEAELGDRLVADTGQRPVSHSVEIVAEKYLAGKKLFSGP